jgi:hypothetical protein
MLAQTLVSACVATSPMVRCGDGIASKRSPLLVLTAYRTAGDDNRHYIGGLAAGIPACRNDITSCLDLAAIGRIEANQDSQSNAK